MNEVIKMKAGSVVYGTALPSSDTDYKGVILPTAREILLGKVHDSLVLNTNKSDSKNTSEDIDQEYYSLSRFLKLVIEGQTGALDMLFTPEQFWVSEPTRLWNFILANRSSLLSTKMSAFVGYCKAQAQKYGIKGNRLGALNSLVLFLQGCDANKTLNDYQREFAFFQGSLYPEAQQHITVVYIKPTKESAELPHLEVCGKKYAFTHQIKYILSSVTMLAEAYGARARQAENSDGIDWKALYHAVRVAEEAKELLRTGQITFPRPEADFLLAIRQNKVPYLQVSKHIEQAIDDIDTLKRGSLLRSEPDLKFVEHLIMNEYANIIEKERIENALSFVI